MILIFHIVVATVSLISAGVVYFYPTRAKLNLSYGLVAATLASGFYLVWITPENMPQTCITGLVYLGFVSYGIVSARHKLAAIKQSN